MNIGATEQVVQESKKQDLTKRDKRYPYSSSRRDNDKTIDKAIYYFQADGRTPDRNIYPESIYVPIENYSANLIRQLDLYLNGINRSFDVDTVDVLITLRSVIFPNSKEFQLLHPTDSVTVWEMVQRYTKCIMQLIGKLAECVLVDNCANNAEINKTCMNIALFKKRNLSDV